MKSETNDQQRDDGHDEREKQRYRDREELATGSQLWRLNQLGLLREEPLSRWEASKELAEAKRAGLF